MTNSILEKVREVITNPFNFCRDMPETGGLGASIILVLVVAVGSAIFLGFFSILGVSNIGGALALGLGGTFLLPIMFCIFSFIGAGSMFVI